jgi:hypothetical protein
MHEIVRFDAGPGRNPIGLLGTLGISKRKPSSFYLPLGPGPRQPHQSPPRTSPVTTQARHPHQTRNKNTESEDWPSGRDALGWRQLMVRPLCPLQIVPIASPIAAPTWSAPATSLPVLGDDAHTGDWTGSCGLSSQKINILRSHESIKVFTYFASYY